MKYESHAFVIWSIIWSLKKKSTSFFSALRVMRDYSKHELNLPPTDEKDKGKNSNQTFMLYNTPPPIPAPSASAARLWGRKSRASSQVPGGATGGGAAPEPMSGGPLASTWTTPKASWVWSRRGRQNDTSVWTAHQCRTVSLHPRIMTFVGNTPKSPQLWQHHKLGIPDQVGEPGADSFLLGYRLLLSSRKAVICLQSISLLQKYSNQIFLIVMQSQVSKVKSHEKE